MKPEISGKLTERAMLSQLHISSWSGMMLDKEVTDQVNADFKAAKEAGRYNKRLVASQFFSEVSKAHNHARSLHRLYTLPWEDDGTRVLASAGYINYVAKMKVAKGEVTAAVKAFLEVSTQVEYLKEAKVRLGQMFNVDDYPQLDDLKQKFDFDVEIKPMPDANDFRVKLGDDTTKAIIKDIERRSNERVEKAVKDIFSRVIENVTVMKTRLKDFSAPKDGKRNVIRDTVVYNISELADSLPSLNITGDPRIDELATQLKAELVEFSPEILRADVKVRQEVISKADKLLKKVQQYMK